MPVVEIAHGGHHADPAAVAPLVLGARAHLGGRADDLERNRHVFLGEGEPYGVPSSPDAGGAAPPSSIGDSGAQPPT